MRYQLEDYTKAFAFQRGRRREQQEKNMSPTCAKRCASLRVAI